ncbi:hypothetical protein BH24ACT4_BH24ACT4_00520 [soil metagenome]
MSGRAEPSPARLAGVAAGRDDDGVTSAAPATAARPEAPLAAPQRPTADLFMRRLLRISEAQPHLRESELRSAFSTSILVSAVRCTLTYLVIPFLAPLLGVAAGVGPWIGVPLGSLAIVFNVKSIRRFWRADHKWRWGYNAIGTAVIGLLVVLVVSDLIELS